MVLINSQKKGFPGPSRPSLKIVKMSLTPLVQSLSGHSGQVSAMAGEAGWLVTGGRDAVARLWASTQQQWRHVRDMAGHKSPVGAGAVMCIHLSRRMLCQITCASLRFPVAITGSRGSERSVRIWNVEVTRDIQYTCVDGGLCRQAAA